MTQSKLDKQMEVTRAESAKKVEQSKDTAKDAASSIFSAAPKLAAPQLPSISAPATPAPAGGPNTLLFGALAVAAIGGVALLAPKVIIFCEGRLVSLLTCFGSMGCAVCVHINPSA